MYTANMLIAEPVSTSYLGRAHLHTAKPRQTVSRDRYSSIPYAYTAGATPHSQADKEHSGKERLLRYPDGRVRCIRYPEVSAEAERLAEQLDPTVSYEEDWDPDRWDDIDWPWDVLNSQDSGSVRTLNKPLSRPLQQTADLPQKARHTFTSPADLLRTLNAEGYMQAQEELLQQVQTSYEIHTGSPWIQSRPVFVLVHLSPSSDAPVTYTLKTKVNWTAAEDELSKVLKRRRKDGSSLIKVDQLRDGVVLFEDVADAERYSNYLEADNSSQVIIAQCDSHDLFRNVQEVRGVVVLLRKGSNVPMPHQLAVSLRNKQSFEND